MKFLTFSFDDAVTQDIRLIELFNKYGMKSTFNLNTGRLGENGSYTVDNISICHNKVAKEDVKHIYQGHEVAAHTINHPMLPGIEDEAEIVRQVEQDRIELSELCGYEVVGFAYPGGGVNYDERVAKIIEKNTGVKYARTTISSNNFDVQEDLYQFKPSVYFYRGMDRMFEMGKQFLDLRSETPQVFYVWGHAYEFDVKNEWARFEEFLEMMSGRDDIIYCTNKEALLLRDEYTKQ